MLLTDIMKIVTKKHRGEYQKREEYFKAFKEITEI